jgi:hypothetical protein
MVLTKIFSKRNAIPECINENSCTLKCSKSSFENSWNDWGNCCNWNHWDNWDHCNWDKCNW